MQFNSMQLISDKTIIVYSLTLSKWARKNSSDTMLHHWELGSVIYSGDQTNVDPVNKALLRNAEMRTYTGASKVPQQI